MHIETATCGQIATVGGKRTVAMPYLIPSAKTGNCRYSLKERAKISPWYNLDMTWVRNWRNDNTLEDYAAYFKEQIAKWKGTTDTLGIFLMLNNNDGFIGYDDKEVLGDYKLFDSSTGLFTRGQTVPGADFITKIIPCFYVRDRCYFAPWHRPVLMRFNGTNWYTTSACYTRAIRGIWGSSDTNIFAVGDPSDPYSPIRYYDGSTWTDTPAGRNITLRGIFGTSASDIIAVGDPFVTSTVLYYDGVGNQWEQDTDVETTAGLYDVWASDAFNYFIVGDMGTFMRGKFGSWVIVASGTSYTLRGVWGTSASSVYIVGDSGKILKWNGSVVQQMTSPTSANLYAVWGTNDTNIYAVGADNTAGYILRYDGASWSIISSLPGAQLYAIWGTSASDIYVAGKNGFVMRYNGLSWVVMSTGEPMNDIVSIWGSRNTNLFFGGVTYSNESGHTSYTQYAMHDPETWGPEEQPTSDYWEPSSWPKYTIAWDIVTVKKQLQNTSVMFNFEEQMKLVYYGGQTGDPLNGCGSYMSDGWGDFNGIAQDYDWYPAGACSYAGGVPIFDERIRECFRRLPQGLKYILYPANYSVGSFSKADIFQKAFVETLDAEIMTSCPGDVHHGTLPYSHNQIAQFRNYLSDTVIHNNIYFSQSGIANSWINWPDFEYALNHGLSYSGQRPLLFWTFADDYSRWQYLADNIPRFWRNIVRNEK